MNAKTLLFAGATVVALSACVDVSGPGGFQCLTEPPVLAPSRGDTVVTQIGLRYLDTQVGTGATVNACDAVTVHYRAFVAGEATPFDSTTTVPVVFVAGGGQLAVPGLDVGVIRMQEGGKRRLFIPAELGFGSQDIVYKGKTIPGNTPLIFDVELVKVEPQNRN